MGTWCLGTWFIGHCDFGLKVGLDGFRGLLQAKQFCDSVMILCPQNHRVWGGKKIDGFWSYWGISLLECSALQACEMSDTVLKGQTFQLVQRKEDVFGRWKCVII